MKKRLFMVFTGIALLASAGSLLAGGAADMAMISNAYARAIPPGQPNSASFMTVMNSSDKDTSLVAASSPAAKVVELHNHTMKDGMMQMRRVDKIDVPAGQAVKLEPGGYHVMMIGLLQDLKPGDNVEVTITFDDDSKKTITVPVKKLKMKMNKMKMGGMKHDMKHDMKKKM